MVNRIGVKDEKGNNVCVIAHNKPIPKDFWDKYKLKEIYWNTGQTMARMIITN